MESDLSIYRDFEMIRRGYPRCDYGRVGSIYQVGWLFPEDPREVLFFGLIDGRFRHLSPRNPQFSRRMKELNDGMKRGEFYRSSIDTLTMNEPTLNEDVTIDAMVGGIEIDW